MAEAVKINANQAYNLKLSGYSLLEWANQFYQSKKVEGVSSCTLRIYKQQLGYFLDFCNSQLLERTEEVTPNIIRQFLLYHEETGHDPGGLQIVFRVVRTFLLWYENEAEPDGYKNPIKKVKAPKVPIQPIEPVSIDHIIKLVKVCKADTLLDCRDKAIILFLFDTGARAKEVVQVDITDIELLNGAVLIRRGKGSKPRVVFLGKTSRKAIRHYLNKRQDSNPALWITNKGERLTYWGLDMMMNRRSRQAKINAPPLHSFRRAFALNMLRAGVDVFSLQTLMGHADLQVLRRYLAQNTNDIAEAHRKGSPVDNFLGSIRRSE